MGITQLKNHPYNEEYDSFCYQNCLKQILEYYGVEHTNLYINMSLYFQLRIENNKVHIYEDGVRSLILEYDHLVNRFYYEDNEGITEKVWQENLDIVKTGQPIIVGVDTYYLPYLPYYHKNHGKHTVILDRYDEKNDKVYILDWYSPCFFSGSISRDDFLKARSSLNEKDEGVYSGNAIRNNWAVVQKEKLGGRELELIYSQLKHSYEQYYVKCEQENGYNGIYATKELREYICGMLQLSELKDIQEVMEYIHRKIFRFNKRRKFFTRFLMESMNIVKSSLFEKSVDEMEIIFDEWEKMLYKLLKCKMRPSEKNIMKIVEQLDVIIEKEEKYEKNILELMRLKEFDELGGEVREVYN